jgi:hypothetical protein
MVGNSTRTAVILAATVAAALVTLAFVVEPDRIQGAIYATRWTARWSALIMAIAVTRRAPRRAPWCYGFVVAHTIHYGTVVTRALLDPTNALRHPTLVSGALVLGGAALLVALALTARWRTRLNTALLYLGWLILAIFSAKRYPQLPSMIILGILVAAMIWRAVDQLRGRPLSTPA